MSIQFYDEHSQLISICPYQKLLDWVRQWMDQQQQQQTGWAMKWSHFIKDQFRQSTFSSLSKFNRQPTLTPTNPKQLNLKSIDKLDRHSPHQTKNSNPITPRRNNSKLQSIITKREGRQSAVSKAQGGAINLISIVQAFSRQLQVFLTHFLQKIPIIENNAKLRQQVVHDIIERTHQVASNFTYIPLPNFTPSSIKKQNSFAENYFPSLRESKWVEMDGSRSNRDREEMRSQRSLQKIENSINRLEQLLEIDNNNKKRKFMRKRDKVYTQQSSDRIYQKSMVQSQRISRNRIKNKDIFYNATRILLE